jgi:hypothetical protein
MVSITVLFLTISTVCFANIAHQDKPEFIINVGILTTQNSADKLIESVFKEIYSPLGFTVKLISVPKPRAFKMLETGEISAESTRIKSAFDGYKNVIRIETPIMAVNKFFYCTNPSYCGLGHNTVVSVIKNSVQSNKYCIKNNLNCISVNNQNSALKSIIIGYADTLLADETSVNMTLCETEIKKIYRKAIPKMNVNLYHFVNKRYANLASGINEQIILLRENKSVDKLLNKVAEQKDCHVEVIDL